MPPASTTGRPCSGSPRPPRPRSTRRVSIKATFARSLRFNDPVEVTLAVHALGRTSVEYHLAIEGEEGLAARGTVKTVLVDRATGRAIPWPDEVRAAFAGAGLQQVPA
jgi:acyl-CoA thioester hydrolase